MQDLAMELGYHALAEGQHSRARLILEQAIALHPRTRRMGELFYAGVACFFTGDAKHADCHWCWVNDIIPDDVMARRCYIAAARKAMPYTIPELGGYKATGMLGGHIDLITQAYEESRQRYQAVVQQAESDPR